MQRLLQLIAVERFDVHRCIADGVKKPGETGKIVVGKRLLGRQVIHGRFSLREVEATVLSDYTMSSSPVVVQIALKDRLECRLDRFEEPR
ncbi:hypothetical protein [Paraburkholderia sp. UYCP14C]|uniref:hypothetical protein n=1 Tax=Paraburkholderia sp. UYCP14C TaxID=2511130 RepID=UPI0020071486|nr:hypothetical protein [Paraburkholderia sp. UYCP14C]